MKNKIFSNIIIIFIMFQSYLSQYPEDYSTIEQLLYLENEIFLGSYYFSTSSSTPINDYRNGISIKPKSIDLSYSTCSYSTCSYYFYSGNDDYSWNYLDTNSKFYPPSLNLINNCLQGSNINLELDSFIDSDIAEKYDLSFIFYFWLENEDGNNIIFKCFGTSGNSITFPSGKGFYQFYLKYNYKTKKFSDICDTESSSFDCSSMAITISNSKIYLNKIKVTALIDKNVISSINCNNFYGKCPYSYYCDINSGECKKCLGIYKECENNGYYSCGRFTKEWEETVPQEGCNADHFNLQKLGEMSFDITPPIKSSASSLSFWFFSLTDINESSDEDNINPNIYHISLEDFFVVTIIPGKSNYLIYLTAYQMYHKAYGKDIQTIETKKEFMETLERFPYKNWNKFLKVEKMNRWINVIATFNKNVPRIGMRIFYRKRVDSYGSIINNNKFYQNLDNEYIYNNENYKIESRLHFKKFYRNSDVIHLNVNIYNNNMGAFIRKIYVYASELLIPETSVSSKLFGFQYIEYEEILTVENHLMPELVLSVPFDTISKSETIEGQYLLQYYMYDLSKIHNNKITKNLIVNVGDIDESLYDFPPTLYRLNLINQENKKFKDSLLNKNDYVSIVCNSPIKYCYFDGYAYICETGYYINPVDHKCIQFSSYTGNNILVPGINANINQMGILTQICYGSNVVACTKNTLTEYSCTSGYSKFFEACLSSSLDKSLGYFYYSYFFNLPPIKLSLKSIYKSYYIQFNFLYETNSALRPKENLRGKKLYLFYTDAFRIWHDYSMKYLGIEDNQGNPSKNLIPNFNTENENLFTISVIYDENNNVYKGKIFLNGFKIYTPSFTGGQLSYILFCHNDTACPVNSKVYWTSGFYNQIKIYNLEELTILNDNSFYSQYIYHNYYSYYNYENAKDRFDSYPATEEIKMNLCYMKYNSIEDSTGNLYIITNYYENIDKMQLYNYGIDQTISLRNLYTTYENKEFINSDYELTDCPNSIWCYGNNTIFSKETKVCSNSEYYKYDNCENFPTSPKNKYFTLTLPLKNDNIVLSIKQLINLKKVDYKVKKITFTFWLKLIAFKQKETIFQSGQSNNICYLEYEKINKLSFNCKCSNEIMFYNYYSITKKDYGKYMHISISKYIWSTFKILYL